MKLQLIAAIVLAMAGVGMGQTTRPATRPAVVMAAVEYDEIKAEIGKLVAELEKLRAENKSLKLRLAVPDEPATPRDRIKEALARHEPEIGMTVDEWLEMPQSGRIIGVNADRGGSAADGEQWLLSYLMSPLPGQRTSGMVRFDAWLKDGKIIRWQYAQRK